MVADLKLSSRASATDGVVCTRASNRPEMPGPEIPAASKRRAPIRIPPELPIASRAADIALAIRENPVVIIAGATGSGKTTQLPKIALDIGRGGKRQIGVTQPRRIAATSVAKRVASELGCQLGEEVGYQIRFEDRSSRNTWVKFMTDGVLLAQIQSDPLLRAYDTLIIDEAHERSLTIDFLLGWLKRILPERPDLKLIVSSATIETSRFAEFFGGAPIIQVEGRTYPVEVLYEPPLPELDWADAVADAVVNVTNLDPRGDILVFLPGEREIREAERALLGRNLRHTDVQPLFARLSGRDQARVFADIAQRRVILATNIAETSLTIPGIVYVIDTGVARLSRYDPRTGTTRLQIEAISQASADQRKGRCGRVREGICIRLYSEESYASRSAYTDPEMKRTGLAGVILRMKSLGLGEIESFPFLDPPHSRSIAEGYRVLQELGALDEQRALTELGRRLAVFPVDPRLSRMLLAGVDNDCLADVLVIVAALNIQDPRERPRGKEARADELHRRFRDEASDFVGLLRLWHCVSEAGRKSNAQLRKTCNDHFLSYSRVREWSELHRQLEDMLRDLTTPSQPKRRRSHAQPTPPPEPSATVTEKPSAKGSATPGDPLHRSLLTGLLSRIGQWNAEQRAYNGARQTRFLLHPASGLAKHPPAWVMCFELVETSQLYARTNARIDPNWLESIGAHLIRRSYSDPHWSEQSGRASVREHATLFGLTVRKDRSVDYSTIAPERARMMFIVHALVRGEYQSRGAFQRRNRELLGSLRRECEKARVSDAGLDEERIHAFFEQRLPSSIVNGKAFEAYRDEIETSEPEYFVLSATDVIDPESRPNPDLYPDVLEVGGLELKLEYRFDPSAADDGATVLIPLLGLLQVADGALDWTIPAWHERKVSILLEELPKEYRRALAAFPELATSVLQRLTPYAEPLVPALARAVFQATGTDVPETAFRLDTLPPYLQFNCRILDAAGAVIGEGRDLTAPVRRFAQESRRLRDELITSSTLMKTNLTRWDFGDLPEHIDCVVHGQRMRSYPALADRGMSVDVRLCETPRAAKACHRLGVRRLIALATRSVGSVIAKRAPAPIQHGRATPMTREQRAAFTETLLLQVLDAAFGLNDLERLPRNQAEFEAVLSRGTQRIPTLFDQFVQVLAAVQTECDKLRQAVDNAAKLPSGTRVVADVRAQLNQLFPDNVLDVIGIKRLGHYRRYLQAAQTRIARAVLDPQKDAAKAAPLLPIWNAFLSKQTVAERRSEVDQLRWAIEEWRVATFAPELKPAHHVTIESLRLQLAELR
jgi:ATP-dependent helicase HrpA